jgi:hypothetical protein
MILLLLAYLPTCEGFRWRTHPKFSISLSAKKPNFEPIPRSSKTVLKDATEKDQMIVAIARVIPKISELLNSPSPVLYVEGNEFLESNLIGSFGRGPVVTKLFVREAYKNIVKLYFDSIDPNGLSSMILTGSPGIGKSLAVIYFLHYLATVPTNLKVVTLIHHLLGMRQITFVKNAESGLWEYGSSHDDLKGFQEEETLIIQDPGKTNQIQLLPQANNILVHSPDDREGVQLRELTSKLGWKIFIVPPCKRDELTSSTRIV